LPMGCCTAITLIPVPGLAYEGMLVEIEAVAMRAEDNSVLPRTHATPGQDFLGSSKFCSALRCQKMIFVSAHSPLDADGKIIGAGSIVEQSQAVVERLKRTLHAFGADFDDVVKINRWYAGSDGIEDFEPAAVEFASNFTEPGPAATGVPLPRHANSEILINIALIAMLGERGERLPRRHVWPESLWDWHLHLPYQHGIKCEQIIFLGGQVSLDKQGRAVHPDDLGAQTHQAMSHIGTILHELGADYQDVCKVMTVYQGDCGEHALNANLPIRASYFEEPGPATTGVPLPGLAYEQMNVEIDIYAMAAADNSATG
jgi:enamine deaminase RidA (YjgF/YER057c/UK114 family)